MTDIRALAERRECLRDWAGNRAAERDLDGFEALALHIANDAEALSTENAELKRQRDERDEVLQTAIDWYGTSYEGDPPEPSWLRDARQLLDGVSPATLGAIIASLPPNMYWMIKVCEHVEGRAYIAEVVTDDVPFSDHGNTPTSALQRALARHASRPSDTGKE